MELLPGAAGGEDEPAVPEQGEEDVLEIGPAQHEAEQAEAAQGDVGPEDHGHGEALQDLVAALGQAAEERQAGQGQKWRQGKRRTVAVGEDAEEPAAGDEEAAAHPDEVIPLEVIRLLDKGEDVPEEHRKAVEAARASIDGRRLVRPYSDQVPYGGPGKAGRVRFPHLARRPKGERALCQHMIYELEGEHLVCALEDCGVLPPRKGCDRPGCGGTGEEMTVRVRKKPSKETVFLAGREVAPQLESAQYRCGRCRCGRAVGADAET